MPPGDHAKPSDMIYMLMRHKHSLHLRGLMPKRIQPLLDPFPTDACVYHQAASIHAGHDAVPAAPARYAAQFHLHQNSSQ